MARYSAMDIARWFIRENDRMSREAEGAGDLTLMKLLKLLYYAEGCSLALERGSLFDEDIVAWEHGPVVEDVWRAYNKAPYNLPLTKKDVAALAKIDANAEDSALLGEVFDVFGQYSAWGLREKTHQETPWLVTTQNGTRLNGVIDRGLVKAYFQEHYIDNATA